jgi:tetratricopeptide (TPR) repeat protein
MADPVTELTKKMAAMSRLTGDYSSMLASIADQERHSPTDDRLLVLKGWTLTNLGRTDEAIKAFDHALQFNPKSVWAIFRKGQALRDAQRYGQARDCFAAALKLKPLSSEFWVEKALVEDEMDLVSESMRSYEKAIQTGDKTGWGWAGKARIYASLNKLEEALDAVRTALKMDPEEAEFRRLEAKVLELMSE